MSAGQTIAIRYPAGVTLPRDTDAAQIDTFASADTVPQSFVVVSFDNSTTNFADWPIVMPQHYSGGSIIVNIWWSTLASSGVAKWGAEGKKGTGQDLASSTFGTEVLQAGTSTGTGRTPVLTTIPMTAADFGTPLKGELFYLRINAVALLTTLNGKADLHSIELVEGA